MPNVKSAEKRHRQSLKRRDRNRTSKAAMRTALKKAEKAIESGTVEEARAELKTACKVLDSTAQKGIIHDNLASRKKSRLMIKLNKKAK